jgi:hypothetical protein
VFVGEDPEQGDSGISCKDEGVYPFCQDLSQHPHHVGTARQAFYFGTRDGYAPGGQEAPGDPECDGPLAVGSLEADYSPDHNQVVAGVYQDPEVYLDVALEGRCGGVESPAHRLAKVEVVELEL